MKNVIKKVMFYGVLVLGIYLCGVALQAQDKHERNRAIDRCGSESNIVENYTNQGDLYFTCKVEKN